MPIRQTTPQSQINAYIEDWVARKNQALVNNLLAVGEQVRNEAVSNGSYTDRTGNLRRSVGYVVTIDGQIYKAGSFSGSSEGAAEGETYARSLVSKFPRGIVLIVVAGMNYAAYVSARGYNVLDSAELLADKLVPQMLKQLGIE